jgi:hypothetical protein
VAAMTHSHDFNNFAHAVDSREIGVSARQCNAR